MIEYLELDDLLVAADAAVGGHALVRDVGLLQASAARPRSSAFGEDAYPDLDQKAAALLHAILTGHPLVDGNKRLGWVATRLFYLLNEVDLAAPVDDAFALVMAIAGGEMDDVVAIASRLRAWRVSTPGS